MPLEAGVKTDNRRPLERVCIPSLDVLPTAKQPTWFHQKRVLREKRGHRGGVVFVVCLVQLPMKLTGLLNCAGYPKEITLLDYLKFGSVLRCPRPVRAKLIANPTRVPTERIFIVC